MAAPLKVAVNLCQRSFRPVRVQVRYGHHFYTKEKKAASRTPIERRIFEEITKPIYFNPEVHPSMTCDRRKKQEQDQDKEVDVNKYEQFLIKQLRKLFESSQMIIVCQVMPVSGYRTQRIRVAFKKEGMKMTICNNKFSQEVIENTKLEKLKPLFIGSNMLITSPEPKPVELVKVTRKIPELIILGGFLEDRLVSKNQLQDISKLPPIEQLHGEIAGCLSLMAGGKTLSLLNSHQSNLSNNLGQYAKQMQEKES